MDNITFAELWLEMQDRWPEWTPTEIEKFDWQAALQNVNRDYASEALQAVRAEYATNKPKIKWFREMFKVIVEHNSVKQQPDDEPDDEPDERAIYEEQLKQEKVRLYASLRQFSTDDLETARLAVVKRYAHMRRHKSQPDNPDLWPWALACAVWRELTYGKVPIHDR